MKLLVIWDIDGTLIDSKPLIKETYRYVATVNKFSVPSYSELEGYMSGGVLDNVTRLFHLRKDEAGSVADDFQIEYLRRLRDVRFFPGVIDMIRRLSEDGFNQAIATMNLESTACELIRSHGLEELFVRIAGDSAEGSVRKSDMIRSCAATGAYDHVVMVGDSPSDHQAAVDAGVKFIAASYGYGLPVQMCVDRGLTYVEEPSTVLDRVRDLIED